MRAQGMAILVVPANLAGILIFVPLVMADGDHGDDAVVVECVQAGRIANGRIGHEFADLQVR
jgi:hypothetical protein